MGGRAAISGITDDRIREILKEYLSKQSMGVCYADIEAGRRIAEESLTAEYGYMLVALKDYEVRALIDFHKEQENEHVRERDYIDAQDAVERAAELENVLEAFKKNATEVAVKRAEIDRDLGLIK